MSWATTKGFNFRSTVGFVTDGAGQIGILGLGPSFNDTLTYPQSTILDGDTFNVGWNTSADGTRDRSTGVDKRLAGMQNNSAGSVITWRIDAGTAAGQYKMWLGICDQTNGTSGTVTFAIRDSNGTLISHSALTALTANQVYDIAGNLYATDAAWAAAAGGAGVSQTVTTSDTSNGAGGPIFFIDMGNGTTSTPLSHFAIQFLGAGGAQVQGESLRSQTVMSMSVGVRR